MQARAAILERFDAPLVLREIEIPPLAEGQVLVEIAAAGVCGSDVHMWRGQDPRTPLPIILGHEGVGRVVEARGLRQDIYGQAIAPGDLITWERGVTCGVCHACAVLGEPALCSQRWVYGIHHSVQEPPYLNGCYASHIILDPRTHLIRLQPDDDPALFVAACCSGATAAHALDLTPAQIGDTVVILGPGPLGAFAAGLARASGAEHVIVIGGTPERLALCIQMGATLTLNRRATTAEARRAAILELTQGRGADLVIEASGSVAAATEGLDLVRHGGSLALVGFGTPVGAMTLAPFEQLVRKNVRVQGVWVSDIRHTLRAISLVRQNPAALTQLVTHRFPLEEATAALLAVEGRGAAKVVLEPTPPS